MNYEAVMIDFKRGHHRRGVGPTPILAVVNVLRKILAFEIPEQHQEKLAEIGPEVALGSVCTVNIDDEHLESPKTLKEDLNDQRILVRVDRTKENMYMPCGWIRPIF